MTSEGLDLSEFEFSNIDNFFDSQLSHKLSSSSHGMMPNLNSASFVMDVGLQPDMLACLLHEVLTTGTVTSFQFKVNLPGGGENITLDPLAIRFSREQWNQCCRIGEEQKVSPIFCSAISEIFFDALDLKRSGFVSLREFHESVYMLLAGPPEQKLALIFFLFGGEGDRIDKSAIVPRCLLLQRRLPSIGLASVSDDYLLSLLNSLYYSASSSNPTVSPSLSFLQFKNLVPAVVPDLLSAFGVLTYLSARIRLVPPARFASSSIPPAPTNTYPSNPYESKPAYQPSSPRSSHFPSLKIVDPMSMPSMMGAPSAYSSMIPNPSSAPSSPSNSNSSPDIGNHGGTSALTQPQSPLGSTANTPSSMASRIARSNGSSKTSAAPAPLSLSGPASSDRCAHNGNNDCPCKQCVRVRRNRASAREAQRKKKEALEAIGPLRTRINELQQTVSTQRSEIERLNQLVNSLRSHNTSLQQECDRMRSAPGPASSVPASSAPAPSSNPAYDAVHAAFAGSSSSSSSSTPSSSTPSSSSSSAPRSNSVSATPSPAVSALTEVAQLVSPVLVSLSRTQAALIAPHTSVVVGVIQTKLLSAQVAPNFFTVLAELALEPDVIPILTPLAPSLLPIALSSSAASTASLASVTGRLLVTQNPSLSPEAEKLLEVLLTLCDPRHGGSVSPIVVSSAFLQVRAVVEAHGTTCLLPYMERLEGYCKAAQSNFTLKTEASNLLDILTGKDAKSRMALFEKLNKEALDLCTKSITCTVLGDFFRRNSFAVDQYVQVLRSVLPLPATLALVSSPLAPTDEEQSSSAFRRPSLLRQFSVNLAFTCPGESPCCLFPLQSENNALIVTSQQFSVWLRVALILLRTQPDFVRGLPECASVEESIEAMCQQARMSDASTTSIFVQPFLTYAEILQLRSWLTDLGFFKAFEFAHSSLSCVHCARIAENENASRLSRSLRNSTIEDLETDGLASSSSSSSPSASAQPVSYQETTFDVSGKRHTFRWIDSMADQDVLEAVKAFCASLFPVPAKKTRMVMKSTVGPVSFDDADFVSLVAGEVVVVSFV
eukprot:GILI01003995.1.p1 GENE.GILI01003995.1~~GILI01003995.1.p1  ORF type:complete len:1057 (-),score=278.69 GILI01003995.1:1742-4912(-)